MAHSNQVANEHYRMKTLENAVTTANLLAAIGGDSSPDEEPARKKRRGESSSTSTSSSSKEQRSFSEFLEEFPLSLNGQPPTKGQRIKAGFPEDRTFYDKWRAAQFGMRESHLLSQCYRRQPTLTKVARMIEMEGWTANHPLPQQILEKWQPPKKTDMETDTDLMQRIERQKWSGVAIRYFDDKQGDGVVATKSFSKGSIICDYHGELISGSLAHLMKPESSWHWTRRQHGLPTDLLSKMF
ncbi:uncharacterized protein LOC129602916 [Betta splendens]|uniref:Uncharacterized protein LOC129602916 n=1 Tax=Betta splendens TaxID=158456 RepID=A0A6P7NCJ2_BETSP|nr:uncharacterized protein LOC129602916 [Betta splendens]